MPSYHQLEAVRFKEFTTAERDAEWPNPPTGLVIHNITTDRLEIYTEEVWEPFLHDRPLVEITDQLSIGGGLAVTGPFTDGSPGALVVGGTCEDYLVSVGLDATVTGASPIGWFIDEPTLVPDNGGTAYGLVVDSHVSPVGGGTAATTYQLMLAAQTKEGGSTVTLAYGLFIAEPQLGATNIALFSQGAQNRLVGDTRIGANTAPTVALDVTGACLISTTLGVTGLLTASAALTVGTTLDVTEDATAKRFDGEALDIALKSVAEGSHFLDDDASYPAGWTEVDAPAQSRTNDRYSFWWLIGSAANASWDYTKQTGIDIEGTAANAWNSFQFGPVYFRDGAWGADVDYYFQICGETAAAIDTGEYVRVHLWWDSANSLWKVRGESDAGDGGGQTAGAWLTLSVPLVQPLYFRLVIRNTIKTCRVYVGTGYIGESHTLLQSVNEVATWGTVYWRVNQTRGAGIQDYLYVGAIDYQLDVA